MSDAVVKVDMVSNRSYRNLAMTICAFVNRWHIMDKRWEAAESLHSLWTCWTDRGREWQGEKEEEEEKEGRSGGGRGDRRERAGLVVQIFCLDRDPEGGLYGPVSSICVFFFWVSQTLPDQRDVFYPWFFLDPQSPGGSSGRGGGERRPGDSSGVSRYWAPPNQTGLDQHHHICCCAFFQRNKSLVLDFRLCFCKCAHVPKSVS